MKINNEKINTDPVVPESVLNMYKIDGQENVYYEHYVKSKRLFESKIDHSEICKEDESLIIKTRNEILRQPKDQIIFYIIRALENSNIEIQRIGASLIKNVPKEQRKDLSILVYKKVIDDLNNKNIQIQRIAMNMIQFIPEDKQEQLREIVLEKIIDAFNSSNVDEWRIMAKKINFAPNREQDNLHEIVYGKVIDALNQDDLRIQRLAAVMVRYAPTTKQVELENLVKDKFELAKREGKSKEIIESPLYMKSEEGRNSTFSREIFSKTGSETTLLLGKQFRDNLIFRHIEESSFLAWKNAYESHINWLKAGFDYVPIEPMYSFHYDHNNKLVNVASGVLDINLEEWYAFSGNTFKNDLDKQKNKILDVLTGLSINHGHPNDSNFCLRFYRDKKGKVDINKIPKIYLIDFDKATKQ
ncbi:MAG: hypothetical protein WC264_01025 [Candidatus Paceibacterota bacterium]|jgi:hypothetical protein